MGETPGSEQLRFQILGPMRAWRGDRELDLGPGKQRAVLAVLLLNANKPVSTTEIVDAVWDDDPPENDANVVQKHVAGLRRLLEPQRSPRTQGQLLTLTPAGYRLQVGAGCLDADVFHYRVRQGHAARAQHRPADAAAQLQDALALWQGQLLAGLSGLLFDAARARLAEERTGALEVWAETELELGNHHQLLPDLVQLVTEFPLRERLRCLLMLALYRCGRATEALDAFRDARRLLVEEFGVEPSEELQQLHLAILRSDPALAVPGGSSPRAEPVVTGAAPLPGGWGPLGDPLVSTPTGSTSGSGRAGWRSWLLGVLAVLVPLASFGLATWGIVAYFALRRRSRRLALAAAGYFALLAVSLLAAFVLDPDGPETGTGGLAGVADVIGVLAVVSMWVGGVAHGAILGFGRQPAVGWRPPDVPHQRGGARADRWPAAPWEVRDGAVEPPNDRHSMR
jgi:DNA-binding SARP family transcriptional activator